MIVASTAHSMNIFIGRTPLENDKALRKVQTNSSTAGMAIAGAGAGINELTALAVTSELAPTYKRGAYVGLLVFTIIPFCPSVLWAQLIAAHGGWRYCGLLCGVWAFVGLVLTVCFYFPPPRLNSQGLTRGEILGRIDYVGGFLSITGMLVFMAALQWGGYQVHTPYSPSYCESLITTPVLMENRTRLSPSLHRFLPPRRLRNLGSQVRQIPHVPRSPEAISTDPSPHTDHHRHLGCQLLFRHPFLANPSLQCLRSRPCWRRPPRSAHRF